jgi:hypothetical protein
MLKLEPGPGGIGHEELTFPDRPIDRTLMPDGPDHRPQGDQACQRRSQQPSARRTVARGINCHVQDIGSPRGLPKSR